VQRPTATQKQSERDPTPYSQGKGKLTSEERRSLTDLAKQYEKLLWETKLAHRPKSFWYPYGTLKNIRILEQLLVSVGLGLLPLCRGSYGQIADIGSADGDLAFLMEKMGFSVDVFDNATTNFNLLEGARIMKEALGSSVTIREIDLDSQFPPSPDRYDAIFFLGTLYHLKNPFYVLERLVRMANYCFVSTRIASHTGDGLPLSSHPLAYLLDPEECNNDNTNFWIFSDQGLKRLIRRTGWSVLCYGTVGNTANSTPADLDRDQRAFCVLRSNVLPTIMALPNPVPPGEGAGTTTITWNTGDGTVGQVYVSADGGEESIFGHSPQSSEAATWIQTGSTYQFRLYTGTERENLLAETTVTRTEPGN
jgi:tRNA (mo5U34)-methyltransferase